MIILIELILPAKDRSQFDQCARSCLAFSRAFVKLDLSLSLYYVTEKKLWVVDQLRLISCSVQCAQSSGRGLSRLSALFEHPGWSRPSVYSPLCTLFMPVTRRLHLRDITSKSSFLSFSCCISVLIWLTSRIRVVIVSEWSVAVVSKWFTHLLISGNSVSCFKYVIACRTACCPKSLLDKAGKAVLVQEVLAFVTILLCACILGIAWEICYSPLKYSYEINLLDNLFLKVTYSNRSWKKQKLGKWI